jgi:hypothetical protein
MRVFVFVELVLNAVGVDIGGLNEDNSQEENGFASDGEGSVNGAEELRTIFVQNSYNQPGK